MKKSKKEYYEKETEKLVLPIIEKSGVELVDVEYFVDDGLNCLRVYIDKKGGITFEDCKHINNPLSKLLDKKDFIEESYLLEVSSPGIGRIIKKDRDLNRNIGKKIEVHTYQKVSDTKEFIGVLQNWDNDSITINLDNDEKLNIYRNNISIMKEYVEFNY